MVIMSAKSLERNLNGSLKNIVKVNRQPFMNCYYKSVNYIVKQNGAPKQYISIMSVSDYMIWLPLILGRFGMIFDV